MIKLLHTGDWHLGKKLFKKDRLPEQELFLEWLVKQIKGHDVHYLLMSGDIFDSPNPPHQALKLFFDFIIKLSQETNCTSYFLIGNHDSPYFLNSFKPLLLSYRVHLITNMNEDFSKNHFLLNNSIELKCMPYFRNHEIYNWLPQEHSFEQKLDRFISHQEFPNAQFQILLAHHMFGIAEAAGSEQVIALSGIDHFPLAQFSRFHYLALGHIHKYFKMNYQDSVSVYPGSPLPLRFSESNQKYFQLIVCQNNKLESLKVEIPHFRRLLSFRGKIDQVLKEIEEMPIAEDYLTPWAEVKIELNDIEVGLFDKIAKKLSQKDIDLISFIPEINKNKKLDINQSQMHQMNVIDLFDVYYAQNYPDKKPSIEIKQAFMELLNETPKT
jgi:exonuclease SbcD